MTNDTFVVVAIFKNEMTNFKEWIDHYLWQGASHFYLVDNGSTDNPLDFLQPYIDKNIVSYSYEPKLYIQMDVNKKVTKFIQSLETPPDWILIADLDEFWFGVKKPLCECLKDIPDTIDVVYTNWTEFGPSKDGFQPKSLRKELVYRNPELLSPKFCFRTNRINPNQVFVHEIREHAHEKTWMDNTIIRCHHYYCQSEEYWNTIKIPRGHTLGDLHVYTLTYNERASPCTQLDTTLSDMVKKLEEERI